MNHELNDDAALRRPNWLELPVFEPPADLWSRIAATQALRTRRRRQWLGAGGMAAAVALAAVLFAPPKAPITPDLVDGQRESRVLEGEWRRVDDGRFSASREMTRLRVIDASLQSAYDRRAERDELVPLWQQRNNALRSLISRSRHATVGDDSNVLRI